MSSTGRKQQAVLVVASTYPRWLEDGEPGFVHELARRISSSYRVIVLTSSAPGAQLHDVMDGVEIRRYRYAPRRWETLVHGGGMLQQLRRSAWKWFLLPPFAFGQILAIWRAIRQERPALIHAHWAIPQGVLAAVASRLAFSRAPLIVTSHGADVMGLRGPVFAVLRRWLRRRCAVWTVVGSALASRLVQERVGHDARVFPVIPMGTDLSGRFTRDQTPRDMNQVVYVGRLVAGKGLEVLLEAIKLIRENHPAVRLLLVGDGPLKKKLVGRVHALGLDECVQFAGVLPNTQLPAVYRRACVHAAPFTLPQGFGLTIVESLGCGCPVVTTPCSAASNMGVGVPMLELVPVSDVVALSNALAAHLGHCPDQAQADDVINKLRSLYDWNVISGEFEKSYRKAIGERAAR